MEIKIYVLLISYIRRRDTVERCHLLFLSNYNETTYIYTYVLLLCLQRPTASVAMLFFVSAFDMWIIEQFEQSMNRLFSTNNATRLGVAANNWMQFSVGSATDTEKLYSSNQTKVM